MRRSTTAALSERGYNLPTGPCEAQAWRRLRQARFDDPLAENPARSEHVSNEHVRREAGTARVNAPTAVDGDCAGFDARPLVAGLITVPEGRIAAAEICVALPERRMRQPIGDRDWIGDLRASQSAWNSPSALMASA